MPVYPCDICGDKKTKYEYTRMKTRYLNQLSQEELIRYILPYLKHPSFDLNSLPTVNTPTNKSWGRGKIRMWDICRGCLNRFLFPSYNNEELAQRFNLGPPTIVHEGKETIYVYRNLTGRNFNPSDDFKSDVWQMCSICHIPTPTLEIEDEQETISFFELTDYIDKQICHNCTSRLVQQKKAGLI